MLIKKYPQSCLMIETKNKKILVDPGMLKYQDKYSIILTAIRTLMKADCTTMSPFRGTKEQLSCMND